MKARRFPVPLLCLLLLCGLAAGEGGAPDLWRPWLLPGAALLSLAGCRGLPRQVWVAGALILGLVALYAANATHHWTAGRGLLPVAHVPGLPGSAWAEASWRTLGLAGAMFAGFALAFGLPEGQVRGLQVATALGAAAMALAVVVQRLGPHPARLHDHTGIFVNENHFAVFATLVLPVVLALAARDRFRAVAAGRPSSPAGLHLLAAALLAAAVVMCRSRAGAAVLALEIAVGVGLCGLLARQHPFLGIPGGFGGKGSGALAIGVAVAFAIAAFAREWRQVETIAREWTFRSGILRDALAMWRNHWVWGTGPGTFSAVYPYYQSPAFAGQTILHAHSEPVQFLSEFGVAGGAWIGMAILLGLSAGNGRRPRADWIPPFAELERRAFALGLAACALHGLIDFPLRIPLLALIAAAWAGVWAGNRPVRAERSAEEPGAPVG